MRTIIILLLMACCMGQLHAQYIYKIKADSVLITNDSCTAELNLENSTRNIKGFLYNKGNGRTEFRKGAIKLNDTSYVIGGDTITVGQASGNFIINQYAAPQPATYWINGQARVDNKVIISVPDTGATVNPYSYSHSPLFQALRLGTNDAPIPSINNSALISFGRHYGAGIMVYDNLGTTNDCYGMGVTAYALQFYMPGPVGYPAYVTWNIGGYHPITGTNEIMRLKNNGNLMLGTSTDNGYKFQVNGTGWFGNELRVYHPTFATGGSGGGMRWIADNTFNVFGGPGESLSFGPTNAITSSSLFIAPSVYASSTTDANYYVPTGGGVYTTAGFPGNANFIFHSFTNKMPGADTSPGTATLMELNKLVQRGSQDGLETALRIKFTVSGTANNLRALETINGNVRLNTQSGLTSIGLDSATTPTSKLDVNGAQGYNQLRLRKNYTPTSSSDTNGNTGDVCWDDNYIYIKTAAGWKRLALSTF